MRSLQIQLQQHWDRTRFGDWLPVPLDSASKEDLRWWLTRANLRCGRDLALTHPDLVLLSDASKEGWGVTLDRLHVSGRWTEEESALSINVLELRAIRLGLHHLEGLLRDRTVGVLSDNKSALSCILKEGTRHQDVVDLLCRLWSANVDLFATSQNY